LTILAVAVLAGYFWFIQGPEPMFPDRSCGNSCINNLRQIDGAIQQWALENKMGTNATVKYSDITPYLKNPMVCPEGGVYKIGLVADLPDLFNQRARVAKVRERLRGRCWSDILWCMSLRWSLNQRSQGGLGHDDCRRCF
jgi:hypothetical protein